MEDIHTTVEIDEGYEVDHISNMIDDFANFIDSTNYKPWTALEVCQIFRMFFHLRSKNELTFDMLHSPDVTERAMGEAGMADRSSSKTRTTETGGMGSGGAFAWPSMVRDGDEEEEEEEGGEDDEHVDAQGQPLTEEEKYVVVRQKKAEAFDDQA